MLINLRNALMAGKRTPTAKDYVQNGLVFQLDGIENTGFGAHDSSATGWKDLIRNVNISINNNTWGDDFLYVDGQYKRISINNLGSIASSALTVELVARLRSAQSNQFGRYLSWRQGDTFVTLGIYSVRNSTSQARFEVLLTSYAAPDSQTTNLEDTHAFQYRYSNSQGGTASLDNASFPSQIGNLGNLRVASTMTLGHHGNSNWTKFDCFALRIYNRHLTDAELAENHIIDTKRFPFS